MKYKLKYPRRKKRMINGKTFQLDVPSVKTTTKMVNVKSSKTSIEKIMEMVLNKYGIPFSKPDYIIEDIKFNPDFVIPKYRIAIFCDGDFWHGYKFKTNKIKTNTRN